MIKDISIKSVNNGLWAAFIIVNSGNKYLYECLFHNQPTEKEVKQLWQEGRKHWSKCS